jgi:3-dehydroquinate synthase
MTAAPAAFRTIPVALSANPYPVLIAAGGLAELGEATRGQGMAAGTKVLLITNPAVAGAGGCGASAWGRQRGLLTFS